MNVPLQRVPSVGILGHALACLKLFESLWNIHSKISTNSRIIPNCLRNQLLEDHLTSLTALVADSRLLLAVQLLTFDDHGISGHSDHAAVSRGVGLYLRIRANSSSNNRPLDAFVLASTGILRKYSGVLDVPWSWVTARRPPLGAFFVNFNPKIAWRAMAAHRSQFVWYRRLFVIFSRYAYVNTFKRMHVPPRG